VTAFETMPEVTDWTPTVSVVIATRGRPEMLRAAVKAALAQDYRGAVDVTVVFDQIPVDLLADITLPAEPCGPRSLCTIANSRTPGLTGGRNSGIVASNGSLVALCDDDDEWLPAKLSRQMQLWRTDPGAVLVGTGISIHTEGGNHDRMPPARTEFADLLESRITELHPSSFLIRRTDLLARVGLFDENLPASYGEDYDFLLRAARTGHVLAVREALVIVHWNRTSFFAGRWQGIVDGLSYLLAKHPEFVSSPSGSARIEGQVAFALAALGQRSAAFSWARRTIGHDRSQLRAWAALVIAARLIPAGFLVSAVNRRGRGL
jgi:GT2 family glycosyltransferase